MADVDESRRWAARAEELARQAGALFVKARAEGFDTSTKAGVDLVTEVDEASEKLILDGLRSSFPDHAFVGEETSGLGGEAAGPFPWAASSGGTPTWIVDPLDGTTNFVTGQNDVVVSIACWRGAAAPACGVIYNPFFDEMYTAVAGGGATCNGKPIRVSQETDLSKVVVMNNIGPSRDEAFVAASTRRLELVLRAGVRGLRCGGSCAMNMAYVASNRLGCYFESGFGGPWDVAAGLLIVQEAGGVVRTVADGPFELKVGKGEVLCGNAGVCTALAAVLAGS